MKKQLAIIISFTFLLLNSHSALATQAHNRSPEVQAITEFDVNQYLGKWYEIARLPNIFQNHCISDISANYILEENNIKVINRCRTEDGSVDEAVGIGYPQNEVKSKLKVSFLPKYLRWIPFTKGDYWILKIDPNYEVALIGDPSRKYLWLLSRTPTLPSEILDNFLYDAKQQGYNNLNQLIYTANGTQ